jgi:palmitoyltransferase
MNNCIGESNLRYFLSFLGWHVLLLWYGVWVLVMILRGQLEERGIVRAIKWYIGRPATFHDIYPHVVQWLLAYYPTQVLLLIFMFVISLLLLGFFSYHVNLVIYNTTTNETYKWDRLRHWQAEVEEVKQASEVKDTTPSKKPSEEGQGKCGWLRCSSCWASSPKSEENNVYDRGVWKNFVEVFNPRGFKRSVKQTHRKRQ